MNPKAKKLLIDGRVFSTSGYDRGMGLYVRHIISLLKADGHDITLLIFRNCYLERHDPLLSHLAVRFAAYEPENPAIGQDARATERHEFSAYLSSLIEADDYDVYVDATPFLPPMRLDVFGCAVVAICYDFIPLRHPGYYLVGEVVREIYYNGLARLAKSDAVICISRTVRDEAGKYLGIDESRLAVIYPALTTDYTQPRPAPPTGTNAPYIFTVLGSHKSKNPERSVKIYRHLLSWARFEIRVNAPKEDQRDLMTTLWQFPDAVHITASIPNAEKVALQAHAAMVAHLSLEEGFGIPLLEALFLERKVIVLDIPINREIINWTTAPTDGAIFFLRPEAEAVDIESLEAFIKTAPDKTFYENIRSGFTTHWNDSIGIIRSVLQAAEEAYSVWAQNVAFKIFCSIPGTSCGVADYSIGYLRSVESEVALFFSEGNPETVSSLPNLRIFSHLDFARFTRSKFARVPGLYNFAFSPALMPGIDLMQTCAQPNDVILIHERRYFDGLRAMLLATGRTNELLLAYASHDSPDDATKLAIDCAYHPYFNTRTPKAVVGSPISSSWLSRLPARLVSHLSSSILEEIKNLGAWSQSPAVNDLADLEARIEYVPLGIDDRSSPQVARLAQRLRVLRGLQQDDVVVGHFGLVLNDLKRLWDVVSTFVDFAGGCGWQRDGRRLFFSLVGKVIDTELFYSIEDLFGQAGMAHRLITSNPEHEEDFDAEIVMCDAIFCLRVQSRGQMSHVFVRGLSLGMPVLVNRHSGYGFDPRTTVNDETLAGDIGKALDMLFDPEVVADVKARARREYETVHRASASLRQILGGSAP
jgi:glycosyltransferase involved in cell wall biosynthesis